MNSHQKGIKLIQEWKEKEKQNLNKMKEIGFTGTQIFLDSKIRKRIWCGGRMEDQHTGEVYNLNYDISKYVFSNIKETSGCCTIEIPLKWTIDGNIFKEPDTGYTWILNTNYDYRLDRVYSPLERYSDAYPLCPKPSWDLGEHIHVDEKGPHCSCGYCLWRGRKQNIWKEIILN